MRFGHGSVGGSHEWNDAEVTNCELLVATSPGGGWMILLVHALQRVKSKNMTFTKKWKKNNARGASRQEEQQQGRQKITIYDMIACS